MRQRASFPVDAATARQHAEDDAEDEPSSPLRRPFGKRLRFCKALSQVAASRTPASHDPPLRKTSFPTGTARRKACLPMTTEAAVHRSPGHGPSGFSALLPPEAGPGASCKSTSPAVIRKKPLCPSSPARAKHEAAGRQKKGRRLKARCAPCKRPCRKALLTPRAGLRRFPPRSVRQTERCAVRAAFLRH